MDGHVGDVEGEVNQSGEVTADGAHHQEIAAVEMGGGKKMSQREP